MKILFAGTPAIAAETLEVLATDPRFSQFEVVAALTREDAPQGRKRIVTQSPVATTAESLGIPVIKANRVTAEVEHRIRGIGAEIGVVIAYGVILKLSALELLPLGWFNLHFSKLPKWRGAAPVQRSIIAGEEVTGVTLFKLDEGMDTGPVAGCVETEIYPSETSGDLLSRLRTLGDILLAELLPQIATGRIELLPQATEGASLAPKLDRSQTRLDFSLSAVALEQLVRGANPEPMAHTLVEGNALRVLSARAHPSVDLNTDIGELSLDGKRVFVQCGRGCLELLTVQPAGKQSMDAAAWSRGLKLPLTLGQE